ncbi:MAG: amidohydrolase family protein [Azospirillaceae bacterium]|nr:amidohydrolase family protein [Azospirillaceae bacterium]
MFKKLMMGCAALVAMHGAAQAAAPAATGGVVALTHVRVIDGTGAPAVEDATVVFQGGRILAVGKNAAIPADAQRLDYTGRTVMPGLISDHSHVGSILGISVGPENYTAANITDELAQYRRYGVTTVTALGNNRPLFDELRQEAHAGKLPADLFGVDQGIGVPQGAPPQAMMKSATDQMFRPTTPAEAREAVDRMADEKTDLVKIWVDDFMGSLPIKMDPEIIKAVVVEAHAKHLRVAAHIHDLSDAQKVVAAGADIIAHGVRDQPVPADFVAELKKRGIWYIATLELDESTVAWADKAPWTQTPLARAALSPDLAKQIDDPAWQDKTKAGKAADGARASLDINLRNLKTLYDAGVKIGFGTDSGATPLRVPGIAEQRELVLTVQAGLTPLQAIRMATGDAAALLHLKDRGELKAGKRADLLVVQGDPSTDIAAAGDIVETWSNGTRVAGPLEH